jgi:hypothetical protein
MESVDVTPSVAAVIEGAAAICDPYGHDETVAALVERFEDDDRPAAAVADLAALVRGSLEEEGPQVIGPPATMTAVAAAWLSTNFEHAHDRERVLRESSRAAFGGRPPAEVESWLSEQEIAI